MKALKDYEYFKTDLGVLYCGDCLDILPLIDGKIDLCFTSPPYNMRTRIRNGEYTDKEKSEHFSKKYDFFHDSYTINEYYKIHKDILNILLKLCKTIFWNISIVTGSKESVFKIIGEFNKSIKDLIIWAKGTAEPAIHTDLLNRCFESITVFENKAKCGRVFQNSLFERGKMNDIWRINRSKGIKENRACFPLLLPITAIKNWKSEKVLDPFFGSGTTAVACEKLGRRWIGIEISEKYCKIAAERIDMEARQLKLNL